MPTMAAVAGSLNLHEDAPAKLNLTLEILGRRADGYHALRSLVVFFDRGDRLQFIPGSGNLQLIVEGPHAAAIDGDNLVLTVAHALRSAYPDIPGGTLRLEKNLPVAAGLGGGSADAAAVLRLLARAAPGGVPEDELSRIAAAHGSDIPVCLASQPAMMTGRGERVTMLRSGAAMPCVIVNPGKPLSTAAVFRALGAPVLASAPDEALPPFANVASIVEYARTRGNSLTTTAIGQVPEIGDLIEALAAQPGCRFAAMAGSGPSAFGLYDAACSAGAAADALLHGPARWAVAGNIVLPQCGVSPA